MFQYQSQLAWRSLKKTPGLSLLMIVAIGFGVAAAMVTYTSHRLAKANEFAHKDARVALLQTDAWHAREAYPGRQQNQMADTLSYRDVKALTRSPIPRHRVPMAQWGGTINLPDFSLPTTMAFVRLTSSDYFPMFETPFAFGAPWEKSADEQFRNQVVLTHEINVRLFDGANSVGRELLLEGQLFQVAGVLAPRVQGPQNMENMGFNTLSTPQIYAPLSLVEFREIHPWGQRDCPEDPVDYGTGQQAELRGSCQWLVLWLEFADAADKAAYADFVRSYIQSEQSVGHYPRPLKFALPTPSEKIHINGLDRTVFYLNSIIGLALLCVCIINSVALLLAKFMRQAPEVGVRRALGASRRAIFLQHLVESAWIGLLGGVAGLLLSFLGLRWLRHAFTQEPTKGLSAGSVDVLFVPDLQVVALTFLVGLAASLAAGAYPAWRICRTPAALYLKTQ